MSALTVKVYPQDAVIIQEAKQNCFTVRKTQRFTALVENDPVDNGVEWQIAQGGGTIDERGEFTPPIDFTKLAKTTIRAVSKTDKSKSGTAVVSYWDVPAPQEA